MSRDIAPALVSVNSAPLDDLLLEVRPRTLKQDLDSRIHIMRLDNLHITENFRHAAQEKRAPLSAVLQI